MNVKSFVYVLIIFLSASKTLKAQENKSSREKYNFNYGWKLNVGENEDAKTAAYNDSKWKAINLPYAWNQDEAFKLVITELSTNIAWYRKTFKLPADANDKKVFIEFEGVRQMGEVYINGQFIGRHENGVMAFGFDLTPFIKPFSSGKCNCGEN